MISVAPSLLEAWQAWSIWLAIVLRFSGSPMAQSPPPVTCSFFLWIASLDY